MTKEDIIRMAIEAGWDAHHAEFDTRIQTFAAFVASAERREILVLADSLGWVNIDHIQSRGQERHKRNE